MPAGVTAYSVDGPFFFGAAENFLRTFDNIAGRPRVVILRMRHVPSMDATGLAALERIAKTLHAKGIDVVLSAVQRQPMELMLRAKFLGRVGDTNVQPNIHAAISRARELLAGPGREATANHPAADPGH